MLKSLPLLPAHCRYGPVPLQPGSLCSACLPWLLFASLFSLVWNRDLSSCYIFSALVTPLENKPNVTGALDRTVILSLSLDLFLAHPNPPPPLCFLAFLIYSLELSNTTNRADLISPPDEGARRNEKESMSLWNEFSPVLRIRCWAPEPLDLVYKCLTINVMCIVPSSMNASGLLFLCLCSSVSFCHSIFLFSFSLFPLSFYL